MDTFKKCDLHVHSSSCYSRKYSEEELISRLKKTKMEVISFTDHNVIDVELYKRIKNEIDNLSLIAGVELNIALDDETIEKYKLVTNSNYFHAIMWFSLDDIEKAWSNLKELLRKNDIPIGKSIKEISRSTKGRYFYLSDIQKEFHDINYYLIYHEGKSDRNLSQYLKNGIEANENFKRKLFYYNNSYGIEGKNNKGMTNYMERDLETLVSKFLFSDAIELKEIGNKFTWINFDGTFDSLKIAVSDPNSRLFTSDEYPNNPQKNLECYLEAIRYTNSKGEEVTLKFSPAYNGIIGSRGSGKTMLASILTSNNVSVYEDFLKTNSIKYKMSNITEFQVLSNKVCK